MATTFLRKIILEELKKVLKEQEEFGGPLSGAARRVNPEAGTAKDIEKHFDQQVEPSPEAIQTSGRGIKCRNAKHIQQAIKDKLSADIKTPKIVARLSDNKVGPTTTTAVNILTGANYPINRAGYQQICDADVDSIIQKIKNVSQTSVAFRSFVSALSPRSKFGTSSSQSDDEILKKYAKPYVCKDGTPSPDGRAESCPENRDLTPQERKMLGLEKEALAREINKILKKL